MRARHDISMCAGMICVADISALSSYRYFIIIVMFTYRFGDDVTLSDCQVTLRCVCFSPLLIGILTNNVLDIK